MSNTPLYDALLAYAASGSLRGHMPGHKGKPLPHGLSDHLTEIDFTELSVTGNLYEGDGPIALAEQRAAAHYAAKDAMFLTGGSSQGVLTMLSLFAGKTVLFDRNSHKSTASAMALFDITPRYIVPEPYPSFHVSGRISTEELEAELAAHPEIAAVFVTSPNYYGVLQDIPALGAVCRAHDTALLVDGAHGAHLTALGMRNAVACGADLEVCSLHKTTRALGQAAILLSNGRFPLPDLRRNAALVGTSSPSYAIMASIDCAIADLSEHGDAYRDTARMCAALKKERINAETPFECLFDTFFDGVVHPIDLTDPCRLVICTSGFGLSGRKAAEILEETYGIAAEMADNRNVVFIMTAADTQADFDRLGNALVALGKTCADGMRKAQKTASVPKLPQRALSPREAYLSCAEDVPISLCEGRISAETVTVYPPGVLILAPGEVIDKKTIVYLKENGYNSSIESPEGKPIRVIPNK